LGIGDFDAGTDTTGIRESAPVFSYLLMRQYLMYSTSRIDAGPLFFHADAQRAQLTTISEGIAAPEMERRWSWFF
jgi:hypothetical protein